MQLLLHHIEDLPTSAVFDLAEKKVRFMIKNLDRNQCLSYYNCAQQYLDKTSDYAIRNVADFKNTSIKRTYCKYIVLNLFPYIFKLKCDL